MIDIKSENGVYLIKLTIRHLSPNSSVKQYDDEMSYISCKQLLWVICFLSVLAIMKIIRCGNSHIDTTFIFPSTV